MTIIFLVLWHILHISTTVFSLDCYVTDFTNLEAQDTTAKPILESCGKGSLDIFYRCITVTADSRDVRMYVQGCLPLDKTCDDFIKTQVRFAEELMEFEFDRFNCFQCQEDMCNSGVTYAIRRQGEESRSTQWIVLICMVSSVVALLIFAILPCFFRKCRSQNIRELI